MEPYALSTASKALKELLYGGDRQSCYTDSSSVLVTLDEGMGDGREDVVKRGYHHRHRAAQKDL